MKLIISTQVISNGFTVTINQKHHPVNYPPQVWKAFPQELHIVFAEFITFMSTQHLAFHRQTKIAYQFPAPLGEAFFSYGLFQSMPENQVDFTKLKTSEYLKLMLNSFYSISFSGHMRKIPEVKAYIPNQKIALVPFTFGKDSLLTFALCKKLGLTPVPIFMLEPSNENENKIKQKLMVQFEKEFGERITTFPVPLAKLKQTKGLWWGWDIFLTQYTMYLIPFMHFYKANYFFWSNEQNCNEAVFDGEGFLVNATFEQSARWTQVLNTGLRLFGSNAKLGSLIEPLTELAITYLLHAEFPEYAKYQTSCLNDEPIFKRWCGKCYECARVYISLVGLGIDPTKIQLTTNILLKRKKNLYYLFPSKKSDFHSQFVFTKQEKLLAFYLAHKRGIRGELISEFKKIFLNDFASRAKSYIKSYLTPFAFTTVPDEFKKTLHHFFAEELKKLRKNIKLTHPTPGGKS